jgi:hypothetical protein
MFSQQLRQKSNTSTVHISRRFFQQSLSDKSRATFHQTFFKDKGNLPIIVANCFAVGLIVVFAGRKIFFHPDVMVQRPVTALYSEGPTRDDHSYDYVGQTRTFANALAPAASPILKLANGTSSLDQVWSLDWTRNNDKIEIPLEYSNYFNDSLFEHAPPGSAAQSSKKHQV